MIPLIFSIVYSFYSSSNSISLEETIYLTIFTVKALNFACPTEKYSSNIGISLSFFKIETKAEFLSTITESSLSPKRGIGSLSVRMRP